MYLRKVFALCNVMYEISLVFTRQKNQTDPDRSGSATLMIRKFLSLDFKKHIFSQVQAALPANTFAVTGHAENKRE